MFTKCIELNYSVVIYFKCIFVPLLVNYNQIQVKFAENRHAVVVQVYQIGYFYWLENII